MKTIVPQAVLVLALLAFSFRSSAADTKDSPAPLPVAPASAATLPGTNNYEWGPVKEVTLSSDVAGTNYLLDLDTGRVLTPAPEMRPERLVSPAHGFPTRQSAERIWLGYLYGLGVDIINEQNLQGLATCNLVVDAGEWDSLSAKELVHAAEQFRKLPGLPFERGTFTSATGKVPPPITFSFRTREGRLGIFQVTEIRYQPKKVKLRFKLVEESGQSALRQNPASRTRLGSESSQLNPPSMRTSKTTFAAALLFPFLLLAELGERRAALEGECLRRFRNTAFRPSPTSDQPRGPFALETLSRSMETVEK